MTGDDLFANRWVLPFLHKVDELSRVHCTSSRPSMVDHSDFYTFAPHWAISSCGSRCSRSALMHAVRSTWNQLSRRLLPVQPRRRRAVRRHVYRTQHPSAAQASRLRSSASMKVICNTLKCWFKRARIHTIVSVGVTKHHEFVDERVEVISMIHNQGSVV